MLSPWDEFAILGCIFFSIPVWVLSYYNLGLFLNSLRYPKQPHPSSPSATPLISILIAVYNEKYVIGNTLKALKKLDYPRNRLHVIVADDSTDETKEIIDETIAGLNSSGIYSVVTRRKSRAGFKAGALNQAVNLLRGKYVLLLDADSIVTREVLTKGVHAFETHKDISFVSYRVEHYNRDQNMTTRLFALSLDVMDTIVKMGAYNTEVPFSFQGGFALVEMQSLAEVGFWSNDSIAEDADLTCRLYSAGKKGVYLKDCSIQSEDPGSLSVWKRQSARVAQGWAKCASKSWRGIIGNRRLPLWRRVALLLIFLSPVSSLCWIVLNFLAGTALYFGSGESTGLFSNALFVVFTTVPAISFLVACLYSQWVRGILCLKNVCLIPLLSYTMSCMLVVNAIGFLRGIKGNPGFFSRTPKAGVRPDPLHSTYGSSEPYGADIQGDRVGFFLELCIAIFAIFLGIFAGMKEVYFLSGSLIAFGALTLKSMNLSSMFLFTDETRLLVHAPKIVLESRTPLKRKFQQFLGRMLFFRGEQNNPKAEIP